MIVGKKREETDEKQVYTAWEIEFGRENLRIRGEDFLKRIARRLKDIEGFLQRENLQEKSREELLERKTRLEMVLKNEIE